jgi:hypothetical protein
MVRGRIRRGEPLSATVARSAGSREAGAIMVDMIMNLIVALMVIGLLGGILMLWRSAK